MTNEEILNTETSNRKLLEEKNKNDAKYIVYNNDLKFKELRNIDPTKADWDTEDLKEKFTKNYDTIEKRLKECKNNNFTELDFSRLKLIDFPDLSNYKYYSELSNVKYLFLNDNELIKYDKKMKHFKNLQVLDISFNKIKDIEYLPSSLIELVCHNNNLKDIFYNKELFNLKILDCSHNKIETLSKYDNLKELLCHNNKLTKIASYSSIKRIVCKDNPIVEINVQPIMTDLDCSNTNIVGSISDCPNLINFICNFTRINNIENLKKIECLEIVGCKMNIPYIPSLKILLCKDYENTLNIDTRYNLLKEITEQNSTCFIFQT